MKISNLISSLALLLEEHGDLDVLLNDQETNLGPWMPLEVETVTVTEQHAFPEEFNMPVGYQFVVLQ